MKKIMLGDKAVNSIRQVLSKVTLELALNAELMLIRNQLLSKPKRNRNLSGNNRKNPRRIKIQILILGKNEGNLNFYLIIANNFAIKCIYFAYI